MSSEQLRLCLLVLCGASLVSAVICLDHSEAQKQLAASGSKESEVFSDNEAYHWPGRRFRCPTAWGAYPDPTNCAFFYICVAKISTRTRCPLMYQFCKVKRMCLPMFVAVCDEGSGEVTGNPNPETTTHEETQFVCPEEKGKFPHPEDCSKYYNCKHDEATVETCSESKLFDGVKGKCRDAKHVHCGSRLRPTDIPDYEGTTHSEETTTEGKEETTTIEEETTTVEEETTNVEEEITTAEDETTTVEEEISTAEDETTTAEEETTTAEDETTTVEEETTTKVRVTAPDTTCDVDDLDCIIDDLGETPDWFVCPDDLGSYPHPTSQKLFIFCINWKPSVKKCGQDLVFSEDHMTCVAPPTLPESMEDTTIL